MVTKGNEEEYKEKYETLKYFFLEIDLMFEERETIVLTRANEAHT